MQHEGAYLQLLSVVDTLECGGTRALHTRPFAVGALGLLPIAADFPQSTLITGGDGRLVVVIVVVAVGACSFASASCWVRDRGRVAIGIGLWWLRVGITCRRGRDHDTYLAWGGYC